MLNENLYYTLITKQIMYVSMIKYIYSNHVYSDIYYVSFFLFFSLISVTFLIFYRNKKQIHKNYINNLYEFKLQL